MSSRQQFSLRWNNYLKHVTNAFDALRCQEDLVDVTLCCEGKKIRAHKMLLSACSTYFKDIFKENPCQHPVIIFRNVRYEDLWAIINFMYHGEVNIIQEQLASFLTTAELLEVQGLTDDTCDKDNAGINDLEIIRDQCASNENEPSDQVFHAKKRKLSLKKHLDLDPDALHENSEIGIISIDTISSENTFKLETIENLQETNTNSVDISVPGTSTVSFPEEIEICDSEVFHDTNLLNELKTSDGTNPDNPPDIGVDSALKETSHGADVFPITEIKIDNSWDLHLDDAKPYTCNKCTKSFKHPLSLRQHFKIHSGATRCNLCSKVLSRVHDLKVHQNLVHGINI